SPSGPTGCCVLRSRHYRKPRRGHVNSWSRSGSVEPGVSAQPGLPDVGLVADGGAPFTPDDRRAEEQRIVDERRLDAWAGRRGVLESLVDVALPLAIDQRLEPADAGGDVAQLARRHRLLCEVDDVQGDPPLLEPALGLAGLRALLGAEQLNVHAG